MSKIINFLKMIKFSHTIFAFPFAIVSFLINKSEFPGFLEIILIVLALVFARSAAMAFNRLVDYRFDKDNPRTKERELVLGKVSNREVIFFIGMFSAGFIIVSYFINFLCFVLSPVLLGLLFFYSYWKRFSALCHFYLGMVIGMAPIGVDVALNESVSISSVLLFLSVTFWISGFDIIYSLLDIEFDKKAKLHSLPSKIGSKNALWLSRLVYVVMVITLVALGWINQFSFIYYAGIISIGVILTLQHIWVKPDNFSKVNKAFFDLNSYISIIFLVTVILELFL